MRLKAKSLILNIYEVDFTSKEKQRQCEEFYINKLIFRVGKERFCLNSFTFCMYFVHIFTFKKLNYIILLPNFVGSQMFTIQNFELSLEDSNCYPQFKVKDTF